MRAYSEPYEVGSIKITSTTETGIYEFCIECNKEMFFISGCECCYCGSFSPFGDYYDENIPQSEWDEYFKKMEIIKNFKID